MSQDFITVIAALPARQVLVVLGAIFGTVMLALAQPFAYLLMDEPEVEVSDGPD